MKLISTFIAFICLTLFSPLIFSQSNNTKVQVFYRDTAFRNIALDESGNLYALSNRKGMVKYDQSKWQVWNGFGTAFTRSSAWQLAIKGNEVWVASSGYVLYLGSGAAGNNNNFYGGVIKFDNQNSFKSTYYKGRPVLGQQVNEGPPSRNILGIFIDSTGRPWCAASYHDSITYPAIVNYNARYHYAPGAVGRFNGRNFDFITGPDLPDPTGILIGVGNSYKDESYSIGKRRTCRSITQVGNEMWVGSDGYDRSEGNLVTAGILRYDLAGNYISKYDQDNCGIPFGLTNSSWGPWAMYQDKAGRVWISMNGSKGIAVRDTNGVWINIGVPANLPANTVFRSNGISGNSRGEVFFATSNGLLEYKGKGSFTSDTSYKVYSTADGLSSNSVFGVASGKDGSIWLATDMGINKITRGDLTVYNLMPNQYLNETGDDKFRRLVAIYDSKNSQEEIDKDTLFIAADGSRATVFKYSGSNPKNMAFRIKDGAAAYDRGQHGYFFVRYLDPSANDSLRVQYYHPSYINDLYTVSTQFNGKDVRLQVVDTTVSPEQIALDIPVKFVLPPVLCVHGIWSNGTTWNGLKSYLASNGIYRYKPYEVSTPSYPSDRAFTDNYPYIQRFIRDLLEQCSNNKISAGKVDVVCHSMGGILTRLYLQDNLAYEKDIHKLITINTPHSGSPLANIVENKDDFSRWIMKLTGRNPYNGALSDLAIGHPAIDSLLNGDNINNNVVPSHVIHTTKEFSASLEYANDKINDFVKSPTNLKGGTGIAGGKLILKVTTLWLKYYLTKGTSCPWDTRLNDCIQKIFNGKSDFIVSDQSQIGGMTDAESYLDDLWHVDVIEKQPTLSRVLELLRQDANSSVFSTQGFHPASLIWDPVNGTKNARKMGIQGMDSAKIISPSYGAVFNRGDSVHVTVRSSSGIKRILFAMGYENDMNAWAIETPDSVFSFKVPQDVMSRINYQIFAFDAAGNEYSDSSYITIAADPGLLVDSITVEHPDIDNLKVPVGDSSGITVWGYFNDGIKRNITYQPGLTYSSLGGGVSVSGEGDVKGLIPGFDELIVSYNGKSDTVYLEVVPKVKLDTVSAGAMPVRFAGITARYTGKEVLVQWATAMEQNNDRFEIEYSTDGNRFVKAGSVAATNYTGGSTYSFAHNGYAQGKNYYRVKQVDKDGKSTYSDIVVAIVHIKDGISLYPNPVTDELIIDLSKAVDKKAKMFVIYNNSGQTLLKNTIAPGQNKIHIKASVLAQGIYNVEILDAGQNRIWSERFIKTQR